MHDSKDKTVNFYFSGKIYSARPGQSLAAALFSQGVKTLRHSPLLQQPRGMFCLMGSCQECLVMVDGSRVLACKTEAMSEMSVSPVPDTGHYE